MKNKPYDIIVFGGICCDIIMSGIKEMPKPGEEVWAENMKMTVGGVFNVAAAASRLNLNTGLPCVLGEDALSSFIRKTAQDEMINTSLFLNTRGNYEQLSLVLNFGQERSFVSYVADHKKLELKQHMETIVESQEMKVAVFSMSGEEWNIRMMKKLRDKGVTVVLDCSWDEEVLTSEVLLRQIQNCDYFLPNLKEARTITRQQDYEKVAMKLTEYAPHVIVKLGADGAVYADSKKLVHYPAIDLGKVIDTTGAGDNFMAGFCYGLVNGEEVEQCIEFGQLCGSKSVIAVGGFTSSLYESELQDISQVHIFGERKNA